MLYLTGNVDQQVLDTNMRKAKDITVNFDCASLETDRNHFTLLDAPGHTSYITNMICNFSQADVAILLILACIDEFEVGFQNTRQTKEHSLL